MSSEKTTWCRGSGNPVPLAKTWVDGLGGVLVCCLACGCDVPVMLDGTPAHVLDHLSPADQLPIPPRTQGTTMIAIVAASFHSAGLSDADTLEAASNAAEVAHAAGHTVSFDFQSSPSGGAWELDRPVDLVLDDAVVYPGAVEADGGLPYVLRIDSRSSSWIGFLRVEGEGSAIYSQRTSTDLVLLGDLWNSRFDGFEVKHAKRDCIAVAPGAGVTVIHADLGSILVRDCGSNASAGTAGVRLDWAGTVTDSGGAWSPVQYSRVPIPVTPIPPELEQWDVVYIEDRAYLVNAIGADYLDIYPHYRGSASAGTVYLSHGAGVHLSGGNTTGVEGNLSCQRTGVCLLDGGLYGGTWSVVTEASGVGLQFGETPSGAHLRGVISPHLENTATRLGAFKVTRRDLEGLVLQGILSDPVGSTRWDGTAPRWGSFAGATMFWNGHVVDGSKVLYVPVP